MERRGNGNDNQLELSCLYACNKDQGVGENARGVKKWNKTPENRTFLGHISPASVFREREKKWISEVARGEWE